MWTNARLQLKEMTKIQAYDDDGKLELRRNAMHLKKIKQTLFIASQLLILSAVLSK